MFSVIFPLTPSVNQLIKLLYSGMWKGDRHYLIVTKSTLLKIKNTKWLVISSISCFSEHHHPPTPDVESNLQNNIHKRLSINNYFFNQNLYLT